MGRHEGSETTQQTPNEPGSNSAGVAEPMLPWRAPGLGNMRLTVLGLGLVLAAGAWFVDGPVSRWAREARQALGGDVIRELEAAQQFGGLGSLIVAALLVWMLDAGRRRRLLDLVAAAALTGLTVQVLKMGIGRPRPKFDDPGLLLSPLGAYPMPEADPPGIYHAWDAGAPIGSELWSMPSSHTSAAVALAVWLSVLYPKVRNLMIGWAVLVAGSRVLFGAHYLSDVLMGGAVGFVVAHTAARGMWGVRGLDWIWVRLVDRSAEPAWPEAVARDRAAT